MIRLTINEVQTLLKVADLYEGAVDGEEGPLTRAAITSALKSVQGSESWSARRRRVGAAQVVLGMQGYEPGPVDGWSGALTRHAYDEWVHRMRFGKKPDAWRGDDETSYPDRFGRAGGPQCTAGKVKCAFPLRLAWNKDHALNEFSCHEELAAPLSRVYERIAEVYSAEEIARHGFNLWGGCYNYRNKRGGSSLSAHAYGAAVDTDPDRNRLRWGSDEAYLAKPECDDFWECWEAEGFTSLGRTKNFDWMHAQA